VYEEFFIAFSIGMNVISGASTLPPTVFKKNHYKRKTYDEKDS